MAGIRARWSEIFLRGRLLLMALVPALERIRHARETVSMTTLILICSI